MSIFLSQLSTHPSWRSFFSNSKVLTELTNIENSLFNKKYTPSPELALRFASVDIQKIKVIILGKDPYPQQKTNGDFVATGRAFEVNGATSWFQKEINPSLKNMIKLIHKAYFEREIGASIQEVRTAIENRDFPLPTPDKAFDYWESQGVLFLNTAFTCDVGGIQQAGSHLKLWKEFFSMVISYLTKENPNIKYFLWGDAKKYKKPLLELGINEELLYISKHPCTNGDKGGYERNSSYLMNPCFYDTKESIDWIVK